MEDNRIIELYFARDERAIKETKEKYGGLIQRISYGILGNRHDSEECESDTYLKAWNSIPPTRPLSLSAYLCRIVRNLAITRYRYNNVPTDAGGQYFYIKDGDTVCLGELEFEYER